MLILQQINRVLGELRVTVHYLAMMMITQHGATAILGDNHTVIMATIACEPKTHSAKHTEHRRNVHRQLVVSADLPSKHILD